MRGMDETLRYPIRTATADTVRAFLTPVTVAFGEEFTEAELEDWRRTIEPDRVIAAFDGEASIGAAAAYTFRLTVPGGEVGAAGVTAVGVEPGHRRQGVLRALMRHQLDDVRGRGEPVAILWASEAAIYQRFGYGLGALSGSFEIDRSRTAWLRPWEPEGRMRLVDAAEALTTFPPVYEQMRVATPGALNRTEDWWRWGILHDAEYMRHGAGPKYRYLYEVDGAAEGYAIYRTKGDWDDRGPKGQVLVVEAMAMSPRAERARLVLSAQRGPDALDEGRADAGAAPAAPRAGRPARARDDGRRRAVGAPGRPAGRARGAPLRGGRDAGARGCRRLLPVECRALAAHRGR